MINLKQYSLLMVSREKKKRHFLSFFKEVTVVKDNRELLDSYYKNPPSILFLGCRDESIDGIEVVKKIREEDKDTIVVLFSNKVYKEELLEALPLQISACLVKPFTKSKIVKLFSDIKNELKESKFRDNSSTVELKDGYRCCKRTERLYNESSEEVSLTKKEQAFLKLLINANSKAVSVETIEHTIWEEASMSSDCSNRLKVLLSGLRKKLPKGTIKNIHGVGYRITLSPSL